MAGTAVWEDDESLRRFWSAWIDLTYRVDIEARMARAIADRWSLIAFAVAIVVGITAEGSVIAGWALWSTAGGKAIWAWLSGGSGVIALLAGAGFKPPARVGAQEAVAEKMTSLLRRLEGFQSKKIRRGVTVDGAMQEQMDTFEDEWSKLTLPRDVFYTPKRKQDVQRLIIPEYQQKGWFAK